MAEYPEVSLQAFLADYMDIPWWVPDEGKPELCCGRLVRAFLPHVQQVPRVFVPTAREYDPGHDAARFRMETLAANFKIEQTRLPVAATELPDREVWAGYRAKKRPAIVVALSGGEPDRALTRGKPKNQTAPTMLVMPSYGADEGAGRAGYSAAFTERVRELEYPQFIWDLVPLPGAEESIIHLDHIQPLGKHYQTAEVTPYRLSEPALEVMYQLIERHCMGAVRGALAEYLQLVEDLKSAS